VLSLSSVTSLAVVPVRPSGHSISPPTSTPIPGACPPGLPASCRPVPVALRTSAMIDPGRFMNYPG